MAHWGISSIYFFILILNKFVCSKVKLEAHYFQYEQRTVRSFRCSLFVGKEKKTKPNTFLQKISFLLLFNILSSVKSWMKTKIHIHTIYFLYNIAECYKQQSKLLESEKNFVASIWYEEKSFRHFFQTFAVHLFHNIFAYILLPTNHTDSLIYIGKKIKIYMNCSQRI